MRIDVMGGASTHPAVPAVPATPATPAAAAGLGVRALRFALAPVMPLLRALLLTTRMVQVMPTEAQEAQETQAAPAAVTHHDAHSATHSPTSHLEVYEAIGEQALTALAAIGVAVRVCAGGVGYEVAWPDSLRGYFWGEHALLYEVAPGVFLRDEVVSLGSLGSTHGTHGTRPFISLAPRTERHLCVLSLADLPSGRFASLDSLTSVADMADTESPQRAGHEMSLQRSHSTSNGEAPGEASAAPD